MIRWFACYRGAAAPPAAGTRQRAARARPAAARVRRRRSRSAPSRRPPWRSPGDIVPSSRRTSATSAARAGGEVFAQAADDLQQLYGVRAECIAHDAHPDFPNTRWAPSRVCRRMRSGTTMRMRRRLRVNIPASRSCASPGTASAWAPTARCGAARRCWAGPAPGSGWRAFARFACRAASAPRASPGDRRSPWLGERRVLAGRRCAPRSDAAPRLGPGC